MALPLRRVQNEHLLLVRANMEAFRSPSIPQSSYKRRAHFRYRGPSRAMGREEHQILKPGEMAFVPMGEVHGTYNPFPEKLIFWRFCPPRMRPSPESSTSPSKNMGVI